MSLSEVAGSAMRKDTPVAKRTEPIFPPRLEQRISATNSAQTSILGYGRPGFSVELLHNGESIKKTVIGADGLFSFDGIKLKDGTNEFSAKQSEASGATSAASESLHIVFDKQPPKVEVSEPAEKAQRQGNDQKALTVSGKTEDGVTVTVNDRWVAVNNDGAFSTSITLTDGENPITILATDAAGNTTKITRTVKYSAS